MKIPTSADFYDMADRQPVGSRERARLYRLAAGAQCREDAQAALAHAMLAGRQQWDANA